MYLEIYVRLVFHSATRSFRVIHRRNGFSSSKVVMRWANSSHIFLLKALFSLVSSVSATDSEYCPHRDAASSCDWLMVTILYSYSFSTVAGSCCTLRSLSKWL